MRQRAYAAGVRRALEKLGLEYAPTTPDEINLARNNNYDNDRRHEPPAGLGLKPTTNTTSISKAALYTQWSKEEPKLRQIGTENQGAGLQSGAPHNIVEPASTVSESAQPTPKLLGQIG